MCPGNDNGIVIKEENQFFKGIADLENFSEWNPNLGERPSILDLAGKCLVAYTLIFR